MFWEETFKNKKKKGVISIIAFLTLGVLLLLGIYFISFTLTDSRISKSQVYATKTYYLAEAGANEAIWKLKNDSTWFNQFITNPSWSANFSHSFADGFYTVSIQNFELARGEIVSTATINLGGGKTSQRVVKTIVFKALGSPINNSGIFTDGPSGNMNVSSSHITINNGNAFCGNILNISSSNLTINDNGETEELEGQLLVHNNLIQSSTIINSETICASNQCDLECDVCPAPSSDLPVVDFESSEPNSFKSRAQAAESLGQCQILCNGSLCSTKCILSDSQFSSLISSASSVIINNEITYITGNVNISSKNNFIINGTLVSSVGKDINISSSHITLNRPSEQSPSGLISGKKINISSTIINSTGVIYSSDETNISSSSGNITGAILARKLNTSSISSLIITLDNDVVLYGLGYIIDGNPAPPNSIFSPIITIEHWEESY
jgi:hypothetical protein